MPYIVPLAGAEVDAVPPSGAVSTVLLLVPAPGPLSPDHAAALATEFLPAVSALLLGLSVPATVVPDDQVPCSARLLLSRAATLIGATSSVRQLLACMSIHWRIHNEYRSIRA